MEQSGRLYIICTRTPSAVVSWHVDHPGPRTILRPGVQAAVTGAIWPAAILLNKAQRAKANCLPIDA